MRLGREDLIVDIDIYINNVDDMYSASNYISLEDKCLNKDLEKYILNSIKSETLGKKMQIIVHVPIGEMNKEVNVLKHTIHKHFAHKAEEIGADLKEKLRQWKMNMIIGVVFLSGCLILIEVFEAASKASIIKMIKESLVIAAWVALWEPLTFILFGWQPILRKKLYYKKVSTMPIIVQKYMNREGRSRRTV